jgi:hypothetical protein
MTPTEESICALIRGEVACWPLSDQDRFEQLAKTALHHNIHLVLFDTLKRSAEWSSYPIHLRSRIEKEIAIAAARDLISEQELRRVLMRLDEHGIRPLLLKGVPHAYTLYKSSALRPRADTDLLIQDSQKELVARILTELGYYGPKMQSDDLTSYECLYRRKDVFGADHSLDVHWRINNAQIFANSFTFDELLARAIEIPSLTSYARGLGHTHALLLACMHRFAHAHAPFYADGTTVYAGDHLRWMYDIHLLCAMLNNGQWLEFTTLAKTKQIAEFCCDGVNAAKRAFHSRVPVEAMASLQTAAREETVNADRLRASTAAWFLANLRAVPDLRRRIRLVRQTVLPHPVYMMEKYKTKNWPALCFLYGYRSVNGVFKRIKWSKYKVSRQ